MIKKIHDYLQEHLWLLIATIVGLTIVTLALTLLPADKVVPEPVWSFDKVGHLLIFGSWTFLIGYYRLLTQPTKINLFTIFLIGVLFGVIVELLQYAMPFHRHPDFLDVAFDALGCFAAVFVLHLFQKQDLTRC